MGRRQVPTCRRRTNPQQLEPGAPSMPDAPDTPKLSEALLDFAAAPGRHALRMGEPVVLFGAMDTMALWALGRLPTQAAEPERLRAAALLFITRTCFAMGNSHYQLLGLRPHEVTPQRLRSRYRALIGLTHPDRAIAGLPPDAAGMINRAHEVLADPQRRAEYDMQLAMQSRPRMATPGQRAATTPSGTSGGKRSTSHHKPARSARSAAAGSSADRSAAARGSPPLTSLGRGLVRRGHFIVGASLRKDLHTPAPGWLHRWSPTTLRVWLASAVLLACAWVLVFWGLKGSSAERRLVVVEQSSGAASAQPNETVSVRLPAAWARALDLPLSHVQMQEPPPGAAVPGAIGSGHPKGDLTLSPALTPPTNGGRTGAAPHATSDGASGQTAQTAAALAASKASTKPALPPSGTIAGTGGAGSSASSAPHASTPSASPLSASPLASSGAPSAASSSLSARTDKAKERSAAADHTLANSAIIWDVDQEPARAYLKQLLNLLQKPEQARSTNQYLLDMKVRGSLLRPAAQALRVQSADLIETHQPGVLRVQGVLKAQSEADERPARALRFEVQAEFRGTHQGTVLTLLNMKELP